MASNHYRVVNFFKERIAPRFAIGVIYIVNTIEAMQKKKKTSKLE